MNKFFKGAGSAKNIRVIAIFIANETQYETQTHSPVPPLFAIGRWHRMKEKQFQKKRCQLTNIYNFCKTSSYFGSLADPITALSLIEKAMPYNELSCTDRYVTRRNTD